MGFFVSKMYGWMERKGKEGKGREGKENYPLRVGTSPALQLPLSMLAGDRWFSVERVEESNGGGYVR